MTGKVRPTAAAVDPSTGGSLITDAKLKQLYAMMLQCRLLTDRARLLRNRNGSAARNEASLSQEALSTGCAIDLRAEDTIALAPRDSITNLVIAGLVKGVPLNTIVAQLYADRVSAQDPLHNIVAFSNAGAQLRTATSVAVTNKREKNTNVVVAFTCKATTALGAWHEALTFSAGHSLPIIFVVENNHRPARARSDWEDFTLKAQSYGLPGITVDGNDVVAVYRVACESLQRVRRGDGPVLIEGKTYRSTGRTALGSMPDDPLTHMERYLTAKKLFHARSKNRLVQEFSQELDAAVKVVHKDSARDSMTPA
jgi:TPP-dependent pyruvate/acetoin dehydrogenase alpha subunit